MSDFDILNIKRTSYADSRKRRALRLDSDSEDETTKLAKYKKNISPKPPVAKYDDEVEVLSSLGNGKAPVQKPVERPVEIDPSFQQMQETLNKNKRYLEEAEALLFKPAVVPLKAPTPVTEKKPSSYIEEHSIEISDEEDTTIEEDDINDLDPELAALLKESSGLPAHQATKVNLKLHYVHNLEITPQQREALQLLVKPVKIIIKDNDQFHIAIDAFCKKKLLSKAEVVLIYKNNQVFLSGTPAGLGMTDVGTHMMEVYPLKCYQQMMAEREMKKAELRKRYSESALDEDDVKDDIQPSSSQVVDDNRIALKLRDKSNKDIQFKVKPTTTLASLLETYKKHANLIGGNVKVSFEGETLDLNQTIEETDLEDEDMLEVVSA